jgi:hypothetical protein
VTATKQDAYIKKLTSSFRNLCTRFGLAPPEVICVVRRKEVLTSPKCVSFGRPDLTIDPDALARHVFGHWLCDLHPCPDMGDKVADTIKGMIDKIDELDILARRPSPTIYQEGE